LRGADRIARGGSYRLTGSRKEWLLGVCAGFAVWIALEYGSFVFLGDPPCTNMLSLPVAFWVAFRVEHRTIRREEQRIASGLCARCGYTLAGLAPKRQVYDEKTLSLAACPECGLWNGETVDESTAK